ncbi:MAG TPA: hypothetical protein VG797_11770 [Phycisphaerales bacterium]|nr:hypothetical protein [Phycisphaerales bacterium]
MTRSTTRRFPLWIGAFFWASIGANAMAGEHSCGWSDEFVIAGLNTGGYSLATLPAGEGGGIMVGGGFRAAGSVPAQNVAVWDAGKWHAVPGAPAPALGCDSIYSVGSVRLNGEQVVLAKIRGAGEDCWRVALAIWDHGSWRYLGGLLGDGYSDLAWCSHDDGTDERLYAGGDFFGSFPSDVVRLDGNSWIPVGNLPSYFGIVGLGSMRVNDQNLLLAAGWFERGGAGADCGLASWNGSVWSLLDIRATQEPLDFAVVQAGSARGAYLSGKFVIEGEPFQVIRYDGEHFEGIPGADSYEVFLETLDIDGQERLYAFGAFTSIGGVAADHIAWWDGESWHALSTPGQDDPLASVRAVTCWPGPAGDRLVATGIFGQLGGVRADNIAMYENGNWHPFGEVRNGIAGELFTAVTIGKGLSSRLYCSGVFSAAGEAISPFMASYSGSAWEPVRAASDHGYYSWFFRADTGNGPRLHLIGTFDPPSPFAYVSLLRLNEDGWEPVSLDGAGAIGGYPVPVATTDDDERFFLPTYIAEEEGDGRYEVSEFNHGVWRNLGLPRMSTPGALLHRTAWLDDQPDGGLFVNRFVFDPQTHQGRVERWNGTEWSSFLLPPYWNASGLTAVRSGPARGLYTIGAGFLPEATTPAVLRWNGAGVTPLDVHDGPTPMECGGNGAALDLGDGEMLYVYARFAIPDRAETPWAVARWNGSSWRLLAEGPDQYGVYDFAAFQGRLVAIGDLTGSPGNFTGALGMIDCVARPCPCDIDGDGAVGLSDLVRIVTHWDRLDIGAAEDIDGDGVSRLRDIAALIANWGTTCP